MHTNGSRFERASSQVPQWDVSGSITSETLDEQFLPDPSLRKILTNKELLMKAIQPLLDYGFLSRHEDATGAHYHIHSVPQDHVKWSMMTPEERLVQHKNAIRVVSHAFPVDDILEPDFKRLRQALATQVFHCVEDCHRFLELDRIPDVAPQLLSMLMSVLGRSGNEYLLLPYAKRLSEKVNDGYFRCGIARWDAYM